MSFYLYLQPVSPPNNISEFGGTFSNRGAPHRQNCSFSDFGSSLCNEALELQSNGEGQAAND
jgi:hypothetical protein